MPSWWEWLCVSRQRCNTHKLTEPRYTHKGAGLQPALQPDVMVEIQTERERNWHTNVGCDWTQPDGRRQYNGNSIEENTAVMRNSGHVGRYNSHEKKKPSHCDSYEKNPQLMPANYSLLHLDKPRPVSAAPNELLRRTKSEGLEPTEPADVTRRRRHVQDIFTDPSQQQTQDVTRQSQNASVFSLRSSNSEEGSRRSKKSTASSEPAKRESMYAYTPRSVNDDDISAALFGSRIDDYNPNPAWNRAMHSFAASPSSSGHPLNFSQQGRPRSENFPPSVQKRALTMSDSVMWYSSDSPHVYASEGSGVRGDSSGKDSVSVVNDSTRKESTFFQFDVHRSKNDVHADLDMTSSTMRSDDEHESQASPGGSSDLDLEKVFSCNGDVLY